MTLNLRLKLKLLLLLVMGVVMVGGQLGGGTTEAVCGTCHQVFKGTQGVGWGCTRMGSSDCVATSTGCTQCASCLCQEGGGEN